MVLVLSSLILVFSFRTIRNHYIDTQISSLRNLGNVFTLRIIPLLEEGHLEELDILVKQLGSQINTRITVVDGGGSVLADSEGLVAARYGRNIAYLIRPDQHVAARLAPDLAGLDQALRRATGNSAAALVPCGA